MQNLARLLATTLLAWLALTGSAQAQSWTRIAGENEGFSFAGTRTVRYGAGSNWVQQTLTGGGQCSNNFFGDDPLSGTYKECDVLDVSAIGWTKVADENGSFTLGGIRRVRYGAGSSWVEQTLSGPVSCSNGTFGDPISGTAKECDVLDQTATSISLASSPNPSQAAQNVSLTAAITGASPAGSVTFKDGATTLGTSAVANNAATFTTAFSTAGPHSLTAVYGGDVNNAPSTSTAITQSVAASGNWTKVADENGSFTFDSTRRVRYGAGSSWVERSMSGAVSCSNATFGDPISGVVKECDVLNQLASSVTLSATPNPSSVGRAITMLASISGTNPTGSVTFNDGATTLGNAAVSGGSASFSATLNAAGSHTLTASYSGDEANAPSGSANFTQTVSSSGTWTRIAYEGNPFTVSGTRTVRYGTGSSWIQRSVTGNGSCSNDFFGSDPAYGVGKECDVLDVAAASATINITASPRPAIVNQAVTLTATVGGANPSGSVTFLDGATPIGSIALLTSATSGTATATVPFANAGSHVITAAYAGDTNNGAVTSSAVSLQVNNAGGGPVSPGNMTWLYGYDSEGNRTQVTDPNGNFTGMSYDALQRMKTLVQPAPAPAQPTPTINMAYDGQDHVTAVTDPRSLTTSYSIDGLANTKTQTSPDTGTKTATYDAAGNLLTQTDARGKVTTYTYDAINRVKTISYQSGIGSAFEYDGGTTPYPGSTGKLTKMTDESGVTTFTYDALGRLTSRAQLIGARALTTSYTWGSTGTATGKVTAMTYPSGAQVNVTYDNAGRPQALTVNPPNPNGVGTNTGGYFNLLGNITYNADTNITGWVWADGAPYQRTYDSFGRLASFPLGYPQGTGIAQGAIRSLSYDSAGRITGYTHSNQAGPQVALDQGFGYDGLDRLTQQLTGATTFRYSYDATGNRISKTVGATTYSNTVSPTSNQLTQVQTQGNSGTQTNAQTYTPAGNLQTDGSITYAYSDRGRLATTISAGQTTSYKYNALEQRTSKTGNLTPTGATYYAYDEQGKTIGEYDASLNPITETVYLGSTPVAALKETGTASTSSIQITIGNVYADQIDTPRAITRNSDEAILWRWDQTEAFGNSTPQENPSSLGIYSFNSRMPGQLYDSETQNFYNLNRDYQTSTGRYVQSDPIGLDGGINPYAYVGGSPLSHTDPDGLQIAITPVAPISVPLLPLVVDACLSNPVTCAAAGGVAGGTLLYPFIERPVADAIDWCVASPNREQKCWTAYQAQIRICKIAPTPSARKQCYARAADIYASCLRGAN